MKADARIERKLSHQVQMDEINERRMIIERIKGNHLEKLVEARKQQTETQTDPRQDSPDNETPEPRVVVAGNLPSATSSLFDKNAGISDTDKMLFDKKFKNYLNHKQEYLAKARKAGKKHMIRQNASKNIDEDGGDAEYYNEEEVLSNTGSDYQYRDAKDMKAAYDQMTTGKKRQGSRLQLYHCEYYQNEFRRFEFQNLLSECGEKEQNILSISKDRFLNYLFDEPCVMMLYSINPYQLGDELAEYETTNKEFLNFNEFSQFLLIDREPTYFDYSRENMAEARKLGRGIKCAPIIAKWIDETGIYEFLIDLYKSVDMHGDGWVDRSFLARKIRKQAETKRLSEVEVIQIVNINKRIPLNRLIYQIEFEERQGQNSNKWSFDEFNQFLINYKRRKTPEKDRLITGLILAGKYDSSYVYVVSQEVLQIVKEIFGQTPKFAEYFVRKDKFLQNVCKDQRYKRIQNLNVRSESNRYVKKENVEQSLVRIHAEGEDYLDIEEVLDFLTNRGRPKLIEYRVYIQNLQRQLRIIDEQEMRRKQKHGEDYDSTSSDEEFSKQVKEKQINRKKDKLLQIRNANTFSHDKRFNVTIPVAFAFDSRDKGKKVSIRQQKLHQMLQEKKRLEDEARKPVKCKEVPAFVKDNLYQKMLKDEARQRKQRLERFRLQIMSQVHVSERLMKPKQKAIPHESQPYQFIAKPLPWYCEVNLLDRINKQKKERQERILEELITRNADYDLPEGVQRMIKRQEQLREKRDAKKQRTAATDSVNECTFNPKITQQVPDFKMIHEHWYFDLENAKNVKQPIQVEPFSFDGRPGRSRTTYQPAKVEPPRTRHSKYEQNQQNFQNIPKTQKFEALVELRRRQADERQRQAQLQKRSEAVRKLREEKFAPLVRKVMKQNAGDINRSRASIAVKIKEFKRQQKMKKMQYENEMIKIYTKVFQRPLLVQSGGVYSAEKKGSREKSPSKQGTDSQVRKSKKKVDEQNYLESYYEAPHKEASKPSKGDKYREQLQEVERGGPMRRAAVQDHELGQYPPEQEDENGYIDGFHEEGGYDEEYEEVNLHTS